MITRLFISRIVSWLVFALLIERVLPDKMIRETAIMTGISERNASTAVPPSCCRPNLDGEDVN